MRTKEEGDGGRGGGAEEREERRTGEEVRRGEEEEGRGGAWLSHLDQCIQRILERKLAIRRSQPKVEADADDPSEWSAL